MKLSFIYLIFGCTAAVAAENQVGNGRQLDTAEDVVTEFLAQDLPAGDYGYDSGKGKGSGGYGGGKGKGKGKGSYYDDGKGKGGYYYYYEESKGKGKGGYYYDEGKGSKGKGNKGSSGKKGKGKGKGSKPTKAPTMSPLPTITSEGGSVTLDGIATVTFPAGAFVEETTVELSTTEDPGIAEQFNEFTGLFRTYDRLSYELRINLERPPLSETVEVAMDLTTDFVMSVNPGDAIEVFALIENGDSDDLPFSIFGLVEDRTDTCTGNEQTITFSLPGAAFVEMSSGLYEAVVTLAPTPGGCSITRRRTQGGTCQGPSIRCPVAGGCTVTSPYSRTRKHPVTGQTRPHWGTDYQAAVGTTITAAAGGTIERSYTSSSYGETVIIRHTDGGATLYAHLDSRDVSVGDTVQVGDTIGEAGNTGLSSGPHLHLEYVANGQIIQSKNRIDPDACIGMETTGSITAGDNGSLADDSFELSLNGIVIGVTTIGGSNTLSVNNLIPGTYTLGLRVVLAPDNVGTWFVQLNDGLTFAADGSTFKTGSDPQGASLQWQIIVPAPMN